MAGIFSLFLSLWYFYFCFGVTVGGVQGLHLALCPGCTPSAVPRGTGSPELWTQACWVPGIACAQPRELSLAPNGTFTGYHNKCDECLSVVHARQTSLTDRSRILLLESLDSMNPIWQVVPRLEGPPELSLSQPRDGSDSLSLSYLKGGASDAFMKHFRHIFKELKSLFVLFVDTIMLVIKKIGNHTKFLVWIVNLSY